MTSLLPSTKPPRDRFIDVVIAAIEEGEDIYFISADMGTESLDTLRERFPERFVYVGIAEQNAINVAAGLASRGKKVFVIGMASFITARCYEQIRYSVALMNNFKRMGVCIIGIGVGFGYEDAGPAHYTTDDIGLMRLIHGITIHTITDGLQAEIAAKSFLQFPHPTYVRMERKILIDIEPAEDVLSQGYHYIRKTDNYDRLVITSGFSRVIGQQVSRERSLSHMEIFTNYSSVGPDQLTIPYLMLCELSKYKSITVIEEQSYPGSTASILLENFSVDGGGPEVQFFGAPNAYVFENGGRNYLHRLSGMDAKHIIENTICQ